MNIPRFTAEATLGTTSHTYQMKAAFNPSGSGAISVQQFSGFINDNIFGRKMTCCGHSDAAHPPFCITRTVLPFERCSCGQDFDGMPVFNCSSVFARR